MRTREKSLLGMVLLVFGLLSSRAVMAEDQRATTVGMPARIDQLVLPGSELEVKPLTDRKLPVVLRILATYPHGTQFRYDLVYYALDPGTFDLKDYLQRKNGAPTADLPSLTVTVRPLLPPGQIEPHPVEMVRTPRLGGYQTLLAVAGALWVLGLAALLQSRRRQGIRQEQAGKPITLADRLRPLVQKGMAGQLTQTQCAELERSLLAYWRQHLRLEDKNPAEAIRLMRGHNEAGPLLEQLEIWLHRPGPADKVDVAALLKPYQDLPADTLESQDH